MNKDKRKELKDQYKMAERPMGIYQIRNTENETVFIGKSQNLDGAFNSCIFSLKYGSHKNKTLQDYWNKLGEDKFVFEILQKLDPDDNVIYIRDELDNLEKQWIEKLKPNALKEY